MLRNNSCIVRENMQALQSFSEKFLFAVDRSKFQIELALKEETIKIHIRTRLPGLNPGFTIGAFCKDYRDKMLSAIVETGEEIQLYQLSCEELEFQPHSARNLIRALADREQFNGYNN